VADLKYIPTTLEHVSHVAKNMREADRIEIMASHGHSPLKALLQGVKISDLVLSAVTESDEPIAILGVAPVCRLTGTGSPWLLGTDEVWTYRRNFVEEPGKILKIMLDLYPNLENYVHCKNRISVRWLKSIGFMFDEPILFPQSGEKFMKFHMVKEL
jgi:hypothetical protein